MKIDKLPIWRFGEMAVIAHGILKPENLISPALYRINLMGSMSMHGHLLVAMRLIKSPNRCVVPNRQGEFLKKCLIFIIDVYICASSLDHLYFVEFQL